MGCELNKAYIDLFESKITSASAENVSGVASAISATLSIGKITLEEASKLYQEIMERFPQYKERLQEELRPKDKSVKVVDITPTASPQL